MPQIFLKVDLSSAIMQCTRYLRIAEQKSNDLTKSEEFGRKIVKPRSIWMGQGLSP